MNRSKVKWGLWLSAITCIGCCAIGLLGVLAIGSGFSAFTIYAKERAGDILLCSLPLVLALIGYIYYSNNLLKKCCVSGARQCDNKKCFIGL